MFVRPDGSNRFVTHRMQLNDAETRVLEPEEGHGTMEEVASRIGASAKTCESVVVGFPSKWLVIYKLDPAGETAAVGEVNERSSNGEVLP